MGKCCVDECEEERKRSQRDTSGNEIEDDEIRALITDKEQDIRLTGILCGVPIRSVEIVNVANLFSSDSASSSFPNARHDCITRVENAGVHLCTRVDVKAVGETERVLNEFNTFDIINAVVRGCNSNDETVIRGCSTPFSIKSVCSSREEVVVEDADSDVIGSLSMIFDKS